MEYVAMYVSEVGRRLPEKTRADIEQEIRSMIEDTLEDESQKLGRPVDDEMVLSVLKRLGPPETMAASYLPPRYLIGPDLFPTFFLVARTVVSVLLIVGVIGLGITLGMANLVPAEIGKTIAQTAGNLLSSAIAAFGWVVIIFAAIQWVVGQKSLKVKPQDWDPRKLKPAPREENEKFNPSGLVVEVVMTFIALALFNGFPQFVGVGNVRDGQWVIVSILAPAFFIYLPWMSLLWALKATVDIVALTQGRWTAATRWALVGLGVGSIALTYAMLTGPAILAFPADTITRLGWGSATPENIAALTKFTNSAVRISLGIALVGGVIELASRLYRLLLKGSDPTVISFQR